LKRILYKKLSDEWFMKEIYFKEKEEKVIKKELEDL
jgi:hypothetical protein